MRKFQFSLTLYYYFTLCEFFPPAFVSHLSLRDNKSSQVFSVFWADLNNSVIWIVATRPPISKSSSICTNLLVTGPSAPITVGITVTFMFHSFFQFSTMSRNYLFSLSFNFTLWSAGTTKFTI